MFQNKYMIGNTNTQFGRFCAIVSDFPLSNDSLLTIHVLIYSNWNNHKTNLFHLNSSWKLATIWPVKLEISFSRKKYCWIFKRNRNSRKSLPMEFMLFAAVLNCIDQDKLCHMRIKSKWWPLFYGWWCYWKLVGGITKKQILLSLVWNQCSLYIFGFCMTLILHNTFLWWDRKRNEENITKKRTNWEKKIQDSR